MDELGPEPWRPVVTLTISHADLQALRDSALHWAQRETAAKMRVQQARRRKLHGRSFILWVEDASEQRAAIVHACEEATGACAQVVLPEATLQEAFQRYVRCSRSGGLVASMGLLSAPEGIDQGEWGEAAHWEAEAADATAPGNTRALEQLADGFVSRLLDAVFLERNAFGDGWRLRIPGVTPQTRADSLREHHGPDIKLATSPGARPRRPRPAPVPPAPPGAPLRQRPSASRPVSARASAPPPRLAPAPPEAAPAERSPPQRLPRGPDLGGCCGGEAAECLEAAAETVMHALAEALGEARHADEELERDLADAVWHAFEARPRDAAAASRPRTARARRPASPPPAAGGPCDLQQPPSSAWRASGGAAAVPQPPRGPRPQSASRGLRPQSAARRRPAAPCSWAEPCAAPCAPSAPLRPAGRPGAPLEAAAPPAARPQPGPPADAGQAAVPRQRPASARRYGGGSAAQLLRGRAAAAVAQVDATLAGQKGRPPAGGCSIGAPFRGGQPPSSCSTNVPSSPASTLHDLQAPRAAPAADPSAGGPAAATAGVPGLLAPSLGAARPAAAPAAQDAPGGALVRPGSASSAFSAAAFSAGPSEASTLSHQGRWAAPGSRPPPPAKHCASCSCPECAS